MYKREREREEENWRRIGNRGKGRQEREKRINEKRKKRETERIIMKHINHKNSFLKKQQ